MNTILGIRYGHDAAAALVIGGRIVADAAEERFTRIKNDTSFPVNAIAFCLEQAGIESSGLDAVVFPSAGYVPAPFFAFFDVPEEAVAPAARPQAPRLPLYFSPWPLSKHCRVLTVEHHLAHAAAAYYTSGFTEEPCLIVTLDGRGDSTSAAVWRGERNRIQPLKRWDGTSSLGWFYSNATEVLGWRHASDEWKTMGLAPYGTPHPGALAGFHPVFKDGELVHGHEYGEADRWNDHGANHYHMRDATPLAKILAGRRREDFAAEVQRVAEEQAMNLILPWLKREKAKNLCCAGGFFLNVKLNQRLWYSGELDRQWIYPNPGDSGLPVGAALHVYHEHHPEQPGERLTHMYYGPEFSDSQIEALLKERKLRYERHDDIADAAAGLLAQNKIVGWFQGRMEAGPRALGNRSILMSPKRSENKDIINRCVKYREAFRPFCPSILQSRAADYLVRPREEPFMITSFDVRPEKREAIPAVVHVDGTTRPQTVRPEANPLYHRLIEAFGERTGEPVVLNTSFNVKGEPIVCRPREAIRCFFDTGLDALALGHYLLVKPDQHNSAEHALTN